MSKISEGKFGEDIACIYLRKVGYKILERNWHCRYGEIDIIAKNDKFLVFVEVKIRSKYSYGDLQDHIGRNKQRKLLLTINKFLLEKNFYEMAWRLDGICIVKDKNILQLRHFKGILEE